MAMSSVQSSVGIILISFTIGFLTYYLINDLEKEKKKTYMEAVLGQLINFIIFVWVGKVVLNFETFIADPLVVLSYPSDSHAFYLAVLMSATIIVMQAKRGKINGAQFFNAFIHIFLIASFSYELIQIIWYDNIFSLRYLGLITLLIVVFMVMQKFGASTWLNLFILLGWVVGSLGLAIVMPVMIVFGYTMVPWFLVLVLILCGLLIVYRKKKEGVVHGGN